MLKKAVIIQWNVFACNYINRKIADSSNAKGYYSSYLKRKNKIGKTIKNDYSATKSCRNPKHCCYISCYRTSKNLTWIRQIIRQNKKVSQIGSDWIIDSVIDDNINISKYNPLAGSSYIKLDRTIKGLINIQNIDHNECFQRCLVRYLNPAEHHPARIIKPSKDFSKWFNLKDIKFSVKFRDIHKIEKKKKKILLTLVFLVKKIRKNI